MQQHFTNMDYRDSLLKFEIVWKDENMFELKIIASNGRYSGTAQVYATSNSLIKFALSLAGYPIAWGNTLFYELKGSFSFFSMSLYCIDSSGHIGVKVTLEEDIHNSNQQQNKNQVKLEITTVPGAIDNFQKELVHLAVTQDGIATLYTS